MMKLSEMIRRYGDINIPNSILMRIGLITRDEMLRASDIQEIMKVSATKAYEIIRKVNKRYGCKCDDNMVSKSSLCRYYNMERW